MQRKCELKSQYLVLEYTIKEKLLNKEQKKEKRKLLRTVKKVSLLNYLYKTISVRRHSFNDVPRSRDAIIGVFVHLEQGSARF